MLSQTAVFKGFAQSLTPNDGFQKEFSFAGAHLQVNLKFRTV